MADLVNEKEQKEQNECQCFIASLKVSSFIYNKTIYIFEKYMKQTHFIYK